MYALSSIYLNPTDRCNLRCSHCWLAPSFNDDVEVKEGEITLAEIKSAVDQALPLGLASVKVTGGEPFLRPDLPEMLEFFHEKGLDVFIETNGTLVDEAAAKIIAPFTGGVSVSLDGLESTHDRVRGKPGAFSAALRGIRVFLEAGVDTQVIMSLHRNNLAELFDVLRLACEMGVPTFKVNPVLPIGRGEALAKKGLTLEVDEILEVYKDLKPRAEEEGVFLSYALPIAFRSITDVMGGDMCECAVLNIMGIMGNGDISICGIEKVTRNMVAGNVSNDPIARVWEEAPIFRRLRRDVPGRMEGVCGRCMFKRFCLGSCRALCFHESGSFTAPYYFCRKAEEMGLFPEGRCL